MRLVFASTINATAINERNRETEREREREREREEGRNEEKRKHHRVAHGGKLAREIIIKAEERSPITRGD